MLGRLALGRALAPAHKLALIGTPAQASLCSSTRKNIKKVFRHSRFWRYDNFLGYCKNTILVHQFWRYIPAPARYKLLIEWFHFLPYFFLLMGCLMTSFLPLLTFLTKATHEKQFYRVLFYSFPVDKSSSGELCTCFNKLEFF